MAPNWHRRLTILYISSQDFVHHGHGFLLIPLEQVAIDVQGGDGPSMARPSRDDVHRHPAAEKVSDVCMPQAVKGDGRDPRGLGKDARAIS
jgi:hypothetical protein